VPSSRLVPGALSLVDRGDGCIELSFSFFALSPSTFLVRCHLLELPLEFLGTAVRFSNCLLFRGQLTVEFLFRVAHFRQFQFRSASLLSFGGPMLWLWPGSSRGAS